MEQFFSMKDARNQFNQIVNAVAVSGKEVILTKGNKPIAKIVPAQIRPRILGALKDQEYFVSEDFDHEDDAINRLFEGE